ncbi:MAG: carbamoyl-phosphate synthase large subunit, partial [Clostridia bacterium]|nr:carbamoyl-phosphate synthase large subunit [Clostridia bacterium]
DTLDMKSLNQIDDIRAKLHDVDDVRLFTVFKALQRGITVEEINEITKIDKWFINKIKNLVDYEKEIVGHVTDELYVKGKKLGYTDTAIERISGTKIKNRLRASYKTVDTCGGEYRAMTPYFYSSYDERSEVGDHISGDKERIIVLGSGPIRIGQGIEFDYSSVHCVWALKKLGYEVIIINNNPETVSTDFDTADRLYFEPLTSEDVMNIIEIEKPIGVVVAFGGQTAIKLTKFLSKNNINILGTSADGIDIAEDRERFDALLEQFNIKRPKGLGVMTLEQALEAANKLGYPVLLRPSYVIGGQNMTIAYNDGDVEQYMEIILSQKIENPVLVDKYMMGSELEVDVISDGKDVLIPGIMQHIERAGVHSGDSIAVYPPYSINDKLMNQVIESSEKLALSLGTKGLVNIQYLIYENDLYVIEVNPRASRTIPYISKVTGVPMVDLATKIMVGHSLKSLGYGTGLYKTPPYFSVKVPVFSFEKLNDVNSALGPEMKSTGEVLGIGKTLEEALFKGLVSAGFYVSHTQDPERRGVLISVSKQDQLEIVKLAKKLDDLGLQIYATEGTARAISALDIDVKIVDKLSHSDEMIHLLETGKIIYTIYTGAKKKSSIDDYIRLHRRALQLSVACITSLDTANALADILLGRFTQNNTELVNINNLRTSRKKLNFCKMQGAGNDYIVLNNMNDDISCPESLAVTYTNRHYSIGADGLLLIERSSIADAKMRMFNIDGSEGKMAGNAIRCVGKYLYDYGIVPKETMTIETPSGVRELKLYIMNSAVSSVEVNMGKASLAAQDIPVKLDGEKIINRKVKVADGEYDITCVSLGNPHCVVFCDRVDAVDIPKVGPLFENDPLFPERTNTEFVRVVNKNTLKMRVWERGNGETAACGTGACAAVVAAVENGMCNKGEDITVKLKGGDVIVNYTDNAVYLTGNASLIYEGVIQY